MGQSIQAWNAGSGERLWLSMLIDAMEQASRPELRSSPCDGVALARFRAQLALPASVRFTSPFSLRN
ncbi:transcriptional regulator [Bradyrhizobium lablabi]|uniref:transcriptional regulator n=1 Tax=Bradyrhizobium lablabi TaxID=722472 RepID=UPI001BA838BF|nr:transcriptional regulator [Bradyrhizobium lablabi]MBR1122391.1 transcriptional regulator [Bradyrhizobium lablabi]